MSAFLDSILDSIDGRPSGAASSKSARPLTAPQAPAKLTAANPSTAVKRKLDSDYDKTSSKVQRTDKPYTGSGPKQSYTGSGIARAPESAFNGHKLGNVAAQLPRSPASNTPRSSSKAMPSKSTQVLAQPSQTAAPKKGSYAEIMARAQKQQQSGATLGAITHKAVQKLTPAQRKAQAEEEVKRKRDAGKIRPNGKLGRRVSPAKQKPAHDNIGKPKKGPTESGYQGTMRSASTSAYAGTMRQPFGHPSKFALGHKSGSATQSAGRASYPDEDGDDAEESWDDDSDMEAGMDELEEEEFESVRIAKREDLQAQREEEEHRRKKLERKNPR